MVFWLGRMLGGLPAGAEWVSSLIGLALGFWWFSNWLAKEHLAASR